MYKKAAESYDKAAQQNQANSYASFGVMGAFGVVFLSFAVSARRTNKAHMEKAIAIATQNQKVIEEIRDILKNGRN